MLGSFHNFFDLVFNFITQASNLALLKLQTKFFPMFFFQLGTVFSLFLSFIARKRNLLAFEFNNKQKKSFIGTTLD